MASLSMPLFVSVEDVMLRMQLGSELTGAVEAVTSGIIGAQIAVEKMIDGKLSRRSHLAVYDLNPDYFSGIQPGGMFRLEVPSGLLREDTTLTLSQSEVSDTGPFKTFDAFANQDYVKIDHRRGYLLMSASQYSNNFIKVGADTGYEDGTTPYPIADLDTWSAGTAYSVGNVVVFEEQAYDCVVETTAGQSPTTHPNNWALKYVPMEDIPTDLYEAIITMVPVTMTKSQIPQKGMPDQRTAYQTAVEQAMFTLRDYIRTKGFSLRPLY